MFLTVNKLEKIHVLNAKYNFIFWTILLMALTGYLLSIVVFTYDTLFTLYPNYIDGAVHIALGAMFLFFGIELVLKQSEKA